MSGIKVNIGTKFSETALSTLSTNTEVPKDREPVLVKDAAGKVVGTIYGDGATPVKDLKIVGRFESVGPVDVFALWAGTQADYDAITTKDANTLYFIQ